MPSTQQSSESEGESVPDHHEPPLRHDDVTESVEQLPVAAQPSPQLLKRPEGPGMTPMALSATQEPLPEPLKPCEMLDASAESTGTRTQSLSATFRGPNSADTYDDLVSRRRLLRDFKLARLRLVTTRRRHLLDLPDRFVTSSSSVQTAGLPKNRPI